MRPKQQPHSWHSHLFRARLDQIINMKHELVVLADKIDWAWLDAQPAECFSDKGRPAEPVRFVIGMFMLKHTYGLSDEQLWETWVHDPQFQYFTGEEFFQHALLHERSGMSHWRKRIGARLDKLLAETLRGSFPPGPRHERQNAPEGLHRQTAEEGECKDETDDQSRLKRPSSSGTCQAITLSGQSRAS